MVAFAPKPRRPLTDEEIRWLHGDESCRPPDVVTHGLVSDAEAFDDEPLIRLGQGDYVQETRPSDLATSPSLLWPVIAAAAALIAIGLLIRWAVGA